MHPNEYTMNGKLDEFGNRDLKKALKKIIACQPDFMEQPTMLQYYCEKLGIKTDRSPVAHCEIAGEGIEFNWGYSKLNYRAQPLSLKQNKSKFHSLVESVLSSKVLTLSVCRANACRARQYMLAYETLATTSESDQSQPTHDSLSTKTSINSKNNDTKHKVTYSLIEKCVGLYRKRQSHRNAMDFDGEYIKDVFVNKVLDGMPSFPKSEA